MDMDMEAEMEEPPTLSTAIRQQREGALLRAYALPLKVGLTMCTLRMCTLLFSPLLLLLLLLLLQCPPLADPTPPRYLLSGSAKHPPRR